MSEQMQYSDMIDGVNFEVVEERSGYTEDARGYRQPTYNIVIKSGYEQDPETGKRTGKLIIAGVDGATLNYAEYVDSLDIDGHMSAFDLEWQEDFMAENVMSQEALRV